MKLSRASQGVHFMDKMPPDFFHTLMQKHNNGEVLVNMESLASILGSSYVLEEDDLHKGNIGFYITQVIDKEGKIKYQFNFFKIDHDLLMMDSIMSQKDMRWPNALYNKDSFGISTRDLEGFPDLKDSGNHYWPTKIRVWAKGDKSYTSKLETQAFAGLKNNPDFIHAKWKHFLKAAIIPIGLVQSSLMAGVDPYKDFEKIDMVRNAVWLRIAKLKQKMLDSKEFTRYIVEHGDSAYKEIIQEIQQHMSTINTPENIQVDLLKEFQENFNHLQQAAKYEGFSRIQKLILLDCYTFPPMKKKSSKPTLHDIHFVMNQFADKAPKSILQALKMACIAEHMIQNSSPRESSTAQYSQEIQEFKRVHLYAGINTADDFLRAADTIHKLHLPLKQQKMEILALLKATTLPVEQLNILKNHLQKKAESCESLKFIKQLRSELWIIRKIKGTYGKSSTTALLIDEIDRQVKQQSTQKTIKFREDRLRIQMGVPDTTNEGGLTRH